MLILLDSVAHGPQRCLQVPNFPAGKFEAASCPMVADPPSEASPTYTSRDFTDYITTLLSTSYMSDPTGSSATSGPTETTSAASIVRPSWTLTISHSASPTKSSTLTTSATTPTAVPSCYTAPVSVPSPIYESNVTEFAARFCRLHFKDSAVFDQDAKPIPGVGGPIDGVAYNYSLAWTTDGCPSGVTAQQLPSEQDCGTIYHNDWKLCKSASRLRQCRLTQSGDLCYESQAVVKYDANSMLIGNNAGWGGVTRIGCLLLGFHPYPNDSTTSVAPSATPSSTSSSPSQQPTLAPSPTGGPHCHSKPLRTNPNEPVSPDAVTRIAGMLCNSKSYVAGSVFTQNSPHIVYDRAESGVSNMSNPTKT